MAKYREKRRAAFWGGFHSVATVRPSTAVIKKHSLKGVRQPTVWQAIASDWKMIGADMDTALNRASAKRLGRSGRLRDYPATR